MLKAFFKVHFSLNCIFVTSSLVKGISVGGTLVEGILVDEKLWLGTLWLFWQRRIWHSVICCLIFFVRGSLVEDIFMW